jgi:hypothetical protein
MQRQNRSNATIPNHRRRIAEARSMTPHAIILVAGNEFSSSNRAELVVVFGVRAVTGAGVRGMGISWDTSTGFGTFRKSSGGCEGRRFSRMVSWGAEGPSRCCSRLHCQEPRGSVRNFFDQGGPGSLREAVYPERSRQFPWLGGRGLGNLCPSRPSELAVGATDRGIPCR